MKTFAAAFLSLSLLAALPGVATAAASDTTKSKATKTSPKPAVQTRKVRSVVVRKAAAPVIPAVATFGQVAGLHGSIFESRNVGELAGLVATIVRDPE